MVRLRGSGTGYIRKEISNPQITVETEKEMFGGQFSKRGKGRNPTLAGMVAMPLMVVVTKITVAVTKSIMIFQKFVHLLSAATKNREKRKSTKEEGSENKFAWA